MYRKSTYVWGERTNAEIEAIDEALLNQGDSVFNTDWKLPEFWTGKTWTNEHSSVGKAQKDLTKGQPLAWYPDGFGNLVLNAATTSNYYQFAGIACRSAQINDFMAVGIKGRWEVRFESDVDRGDLYVMSGTGAVSVGTASQGCIGIALESKTIGGGKFIDVWCTVDTVEKY